MSVFVPDSLPHGRAKARIWEVRINKGNSMLQGSLVTDPGLAGSCTHCIVPVFPGSPDRCGWQTLPSALRHGSAAAGAVQFVTESWVVDSMEAGRWLAGAEGQHQPPPPALPASHAAVPRSSGLMRSPSLEPFEDEAAPDMFSLLNWNIWLYDGDGAARMAALWREVLLRDRPTFLLFQEVTLQHWARLQEQPWFQSYHAAFGPPPHECRSFTVLLCRRDSVQRLQPREVYQFSVNYTECGALSDKRDIKSLCCEVGGTRLLISTTHIMNTSGNLNQIHEMNAELARHHERNSVIAGDMNWHLGWEMPMPKGWVDVWKQQRPHEAGNTWDPSVCSPKGRSGSVARLDRVLSRLTDWEPAYIELVGQQPVAEGMWVSDHLGLFARFQRTRRPSR